MKKAFIPLLLLVLLAQFLLPSSAVANMPAVTSVVPGCVVGPDITATPSDLNFGEILIGLTSPSGTVTIKNDGSAGSVLTINSISITGINPPDFSVDIPFALPKHLNRNESTTVQVYFSPLFTGVRSARLRIESNDPDEAVRNVSLTGRGTTAPDIEVTPDHIDFGPIPVSENSTPETVTITNTGSAGLCVSNAYIAGVDASQFAITSVTGTSNLLPPGASASATIVFSPTSTGTKNAYLRIESNDPDENPFDVPLCGTGTQPGIAVDPESLDFGNVTVNTTSAGKSVTVTNTGDAALEITLITIDNIRFEISSGNLTGQSLAPGASADIALVFKPLVVGAQSGTMTIQSNAGTRTVALSGNGTAAPEPQPGIAVDPESLDFGHVTVNTTSAGKSVTVTNTGDAALEITLITIDNIRFEISSGNLTGQSLAPGASADIALVFKPLVVGAQSGTMTIQSNAGTRTVALSGNGTAAPEPQPDITANPPTVDFGIVPAGSLSDTRTVTVANAGDGVLTIGLVSLVGPDAGHFQIVTDQVSGEGLIAGEWADITIRFAPLTAGQKDARLAVPSNDPDEPVKYIELDGFAMQLWPGVYIDPSYLDFGYVLPGMTSAPQTVTIINTGTGDLEIGTVYIGGPDAGEFAIRSDGTSGAVLPPWGHVTISVEFSPLTPWDKQAGLYIPTNDPAVPLAYVHLEGFGIPTWVEIYVEPYYLDFGRVEVGSASAPRGVTVYNAGTGNLEIGSLYIGGADAGHFEIVNDDATGETLLPGEWATVSVRFAPGSVSDKTAYLYIPSNDSYWPVVSVLLTGRGYEDYPYIDIYPWYIDFGHVLTHGSSAPRLVTVSNLGAGDLEVGTVSILGANAGEFSIDNDNASLQTIAPGASATFEVTFEPVTPGDKSAVVRVPSNDPYGNPQYVTLSGSASDEPLPGIAVDPESVEFGNVTVNTTSVGKSVTVTNTGDAVLEITLITIDNGRFEVSSGNLTGQNLASGASADITLVFKPLAEGYQAGTMTIESNAGTKTVALSGTGTVPRPDIDVSPIALDFGLVTVGQPASSDLTVKNVGDETLNIDSVTIDDGQFVVTSGNLSGQALGAGESANITVTFTPDTLGLKNGILTITSDDPDEAMVEVTLSGTGTEDREVDLQITKTADKQSIAYGDNLTYTLTVINAGDGFATGVTVTDILVPLLTYVSDNASAGTVNATLNGMYWNVIWDIGDMAPGDNATLEIVTTLSPLVLVAGLPMPLSNTAEVAGNEPDPDTSNNSGSVITDVVTTDLLITKTESADPIGLSDNFTWTLTVTNNGPVDATGVLVQELYIPDMTEILALHPSTGSISSTPPDWLNDLLQQYGLLPTGVGILYWQIGDLADGETATLAIDASANITFLQQLMGPSEWQGPLGWPGLPDFSQIFMLFSSFFGGGLFDFAVPMPDMAVVLSTTVDSDISNNTAYEETTASLEFPACDLQLEKTGPEMVVPGDNITYTLTVTNAGPEDAEDVRVIDSWPESTLVSPEFTTDNGTASLGLPDWLVDIMAMMSGWLPAGQEYMYWDIGDLPVGASANLTFQASTNATMAGQTQGTINMALVTGAVTDKNFSNNMRMVQTLFSRADLEIEKTGSSDMVFSGDLYSILKMLGGLDMVASGGDIAYSIKVTNHGPTAAGNVSVTDMLPVGVAFGSAAVSQGSAVQSGGQVTWDIGNMAPGASANMTIFVTAPVIEVPITLIANTANVSSGNDPNPLNDSDTVNTAVVRADYADVVIIKTDAPDPVAAGDNLTYTIAVGNAGLAAAEGVFVDDTLPAGLTLLSATPSVGTYQIVGGTVTWNVGSLAPGELAYLTIVARVDTEPGAQLVNTATAYGEYLEADPGNNSSTTTTDVVAPGTADLEITKLDEPDPVDAGQDVTYTLTVKNNGPAAATGVTVIDNLSENVTYSSSAPAGVYSSINGTLTWDIGELAVGASANLTLVVTPDIASGNVTNSAVVSGNEIDPIETNNSAVAETTVLSFTSFKFLDLAIAKSDSPDPVITGGALDYTITVTNNSVDDATGVVVVDDLPGMVIYVSDVPSTGTTGFASGNLTWEIGDLASGASATLAISVLAPTTPGLLSNTATVTGLPVMGPGDVGFNVSPFDDVAMESTIVLPDIVRRPDIEVTPLTLNFGGVNLNSTSQRTVTVRNTGDANLTITSISVSDGQFTIFSGDLSGQTLGAGASATMTLGFTPGSTGLKTGTMSIFSNDPDEDPVIVDLTGTGTSGGGPIGGGVAAVGGNYFTVDFLGKITQEEADAEFRPVRDVTAPSPDGAHTLEIPARTAATADGDPVALLKIRLATAPRLPENTSLIGSAYEFTPSGTVFDKPITLTLTYDVNELPENVASVGTAYYSSTQGWIYLESESDVVAELGRLTSPVNHFTIFAVLAQVAPEPPVTPPPPPETTTTEPPVVPPPPETPKPASFQLSNLNISRSVVKSFKGLTYTTRTGENAVISVDVTNTGGQPGSYAATLVVNGQDRETQRVTLQPGQTRTLTFTLGPNETGTFDIRIGDLGGTFISDLWLNWWLFVGTAAVIGLIAWGVWFLIARYRRRKSAAPA